MSPAARATRRTSRQLGTGLVLLALWLQVLAQAAMPHARPLPGGPAIAAALCGAAPSRTADAPQDPAAPCDGTCGPCCGTAPVPVLSAPVPPVHRLVFAVSAWPIPPPPGPRAARLRRAEPRGPPRSS